MTPSKIKGYATSEGTARYRDRHEKLKVQGHFREKHELHFSSIGMGSYLGESDEATDRAYASALETALVSGINVLDSAINYRAQRSERVFGQVLTRLIQEGKIKRDEIIICSKGGFIPFDGKHPANPEAFFAENYLAPGIIKPEDIAQGCHAMTPAYLEDQLNKSLQNLNLETLDIYYVHNPETQLADFDPEVFLGRMRETFRWLEKQVERGKIQYYGTATWQGYRIAPGERGYLSLEELSMIAREAGGPGHHFKAVQIPFNFAMPEAWVLMNQSYGANHVSLFAAAKRMDMIIVASASLLQGRLSGKLPEFLHEHFSHYRKSAQISLQFARSGSAMTTALVGMKSPEHVLENLETASKPPLSEEEMILLFQRDPQ